MKLSEGFIIISVFSLLLSSCDSGADTSNETPQAIEEVMEEQEVDALDAQTLTFLTGNTENSSKRWVWSRSETEHFGVGSTDLVFPNFFAAQPNELNPCLYDDVLIFEVDANGNPTFELDTGVNDNIYVNWAEVTRFFPNAEPRESIDECLPITDRISTSSEFTVTQGSNLSFLNVPGSTLSYFNGASRYEILELSENRMVLRSIQDPFNGGNNLAWYFTFVPEEFDPIAEEPTFETLVWSDEFDVDGAPNPENWTFETGNGCPDLCGFGNQELQYYTDRSENVEVSDGVLRITARRQSLGGAQFTSTRMNTMDKFEFTFGRIEARIRLPFGVGTWPAFWMLGADILENPWPAAGEIDIMEHVGRLQNTIHGTTHDPTAFGGNGRTESIDIPGASDEFHVYTVIWSSTQIRWFVDDIQYHQISNNSRLPFDKDFFILLNVAMGGTFGGPVNNTFVESSMEVDYVRVYQ